MKLLDCIRLYQEIIFDRGTEFNREYIQHDGKVIYRDLLLYPTHPDAYANFKRDYLALEEEPDYIKIIDNYKHLDLDIAYFIYEKDQKPNFTQESDYNKLR